MLARSLRRRARLVVAATVTALSVSLAPVLATGPAHADGLLPYVPWSSYLVGWTDEYVPSSENDCVAGRDSCLKATLREMSRIADSTANACGHDAVFARAYLRMTQLYGHTREIPGYYEDVRAVNHLDAVFAKYYFDAYHGWKSGNRSTVPQSWLIALDAARDKRVTGAGDLLLGMNAHINRDLAFVLAGTGLVSPEGSSYKRDYDAVEQWLYDATAPLMAEFAARFDPTIDDTSDPLGLGNWTLFQMVSAWRENAWRNAELLVSAPTPAARAVVAATIEAEANAAAQSLLLLQSYTPPFTTTVSRDLYCAAHKGDAPPVAYEFGYADAWGYAY
ncbi:DUF5995 family protein [Nocardioides sp.]|uniref:DUF5995 family protein n=1 Tax=Nocardioides sp. TaxID=35761 RepID=UPI001A314660|nr:DUF5995 family protein [Nocardioides sp.]MBJ7356245.1 hypothetical protein [Nocardioides sp.]